MPQYPPGWSDNLQTGVVKTRRPIRRMSALGLHHNDVAREREKYLGRETPQAERRRKRRNYSQLAKAWEI